MFFCHLLTLFHYILYISDNVELDEAVEAWTNRQLGHSVHFNTAVTSQEIFAKLRI